LPRVALEVLLHNLLEIGDIFFVWSRFEASKTVSLLFFGTFVKVTKIIYPLFPLCPAILDAASSSLLKDLKYPGKVLASLRRISSFFATGRFKKKCHIFSKTWCVKKTQTYM